MSADNDLCPRCQTNLSGGGRVGVEIHGVYDGVLFWQCLACGGRWHRWEDQYMRDKAEPFIRAAQCGAEDLEFGHKCRREAEHEGEHECGLADENDNWCEQGDEPCNATWT